MFLFILTPIAYRRHVCGTAINNEVRKRFSFSLAPIACRRPVCG
ncbi:hypothetical protein [Anaerocolumna jejuensis]